MVHTDWQHYSVAVAESPQLGPLVLDGCLPLPQRPLRTFYLLYLRFEVAHDMHIFVDILR